MEPERVAALRIEADASQRLLPVEALVGDQREEVGPEVMSPAEDAEADQRTAEEGDEEQEPRHLLGPPRGRCVHQITSIFFQSKT